MIKQFLTRNLSKMKLDSIDTQLLNFLQKDAKQTNKELASKLDMSVTAVYERIKKLEKAGVIDKYVALLKKQSVGKGICRILPYQTGKTFSRTGASI